MEDQTEQEQALVNGNSVATSANESKLPNGQTKEGPVAIKISNAYKHYTSGQKRTPVLLGLDMEVKKGQIYGLLGPSGCGKTTVLKCIVGKLTVETGSVRVFGEPPGTPASGVPGPRVGYMPQELAIFLEFNIEETLTYFRRIFGMTRKQYEDRLQFLMKFLDLPSKTRSLINMSGGQQRRASLAIALLHEPELLILDEPTVGVDPLLRSAIWNHLTEMTDCFGKHCTIVITTHYIEEARQANRVGMMRFGKLLAEDSPEELLRRFSKPNLEDVFLDLCLQDGDLETAKVREERTQRRSILKFSKKKSEAAKPDLENGQGCQMVVTNGKGPKPKEKVSATNSTASARSVSSTVSKYIDQKKSNLTSQRVTACMIKTFNRMKKRVGLLVYQFILPALQVSLFCLAIGQDPKELPVAVVNLENQGQPCAGHPTECPFDMTFIGPEINDNLQNLSCRYLSFMDASIARPVYYENYEDAHQAVKNGEAWGVISMGQNFSRNLYDRIFESVASEDLTKVNLDKFNASQIQVEMDITNQHIAFTLQLKFAEAFQQFMEQLVTSCGINKAVANIPLTFLDPIYGTPELTFTDFMAPGIILTIVHSMALGYSAMIIILERNEGLLDRTWIAGVTPGEFALAHFLVSLVVNFLQVVVTLTFMILVFQVPNEGSLCLVFLLTMLQGVAGTTIGLIISAVCKTQQDATQIALGIFYPNLILSGIIWPVESMPLALRYFAYTLPQTFACEAMRGILLRGWGMAFMPVWRGFVVTLAWIIGTYIIFKRLVTK
uniref:ATP-binding cassette transporter sub-family H 103004 n=1 Tax=Tigriopus japonicus TaxID=158387 RepID=A0A0A7ARN4_TIGJA|nr:ATP-binding cassette transporter sub-family H 103004 [Tigriopus japonicus]